MLAVILARKGSKRIPEKNIRELGGKPLISWVLEAAISSKVFSKVLISTDCGRIARIARNCGAWVPFIRPPELSSDSAESVDALIHAVEWLLHSKNIEKPKTVCLVQATSPFLSASYLQDAKLKFEIGGFTSMSSMCQVRERPEWMFSLGPGNLAKPLNPDKLSDPSSKLPVYYIENGAMFFIKTEFLLRARSLYDLNNHGGFVMSREDSIDIDTPEDWLLAEESFRRRKSKT